MKHLLTLFLVLFMAAAAQAATAGFSKGNQFYAVPLEGTVTVSCGPDQVVEFTCHDKVLDPFNYDYFIGPEGVSASSVTLSSFHQDGSRRDRTEGYIDRSRKSANAFNLWISTPFQRPLLEMGENKVDYKLTTGGQVVEQGSFQVKVVNGAGRICPATYYNSLDANDCKSPYTVCQKYFEQFDYCR